MSEQQTIDEEMTAKIKLRIQEVLGHRIKNPLKTVKRIKKITLISLINTCPEIID